MMENVGGKIGLKYVSFTNTKIEEVPHLELFVL